MNEDNDDLTDDFEDDLDLGGESFDDFDKKGVGLSASLREKPAVKFGIIIAVIVVVIGIFMMFRDEKPLVVSAVPQGSEVTAPPGTTEVSPAIREAIEEADEQRREEAERTAGSALPTLMEPPVGRIQLPAEESQEEDPLQRWRRLQQERIDREAERARLLQPESLQSNTISQAEIDAMKAAMSAQMEIILSSQKQITGGSLEITPVSYLEELFPPVVEETTRDSVVIAEVVVPAGEIVYAQLITEANSDVPGPVLAQITSGPLRGSRVLGAFTVQEELLALTFNTIVRDGISSSISAVALDPATTLPAMATEVDHRYWKRIILPAAAAFIEGTADAISRSGTTTITVSGDTTSSTTSNADTDTEEQISAGVSDAAEEIGDILDDMADNTKVLVKIHSGTPMGLLFLQPVLKN